jgi:Cellulose binding domain
MYKVSISSTSNWGSGSSSAGNGLITVTNLTSNTINHWSVHFTITGMTIGQLWNMSFTKSGNNYTVSASPATGHTSIGANQTITSGFGYTGLAHFIVTTTDPNVIIYTPPTPTPPTPTPPTPTPPTPTPPTPTPPTPTPPTPTPPTPTPPTPQMNNNQRRVAYLGFWLQDADIPTIVNTLKGSGVTHLLLTFIVQPSNTKALTGSSYMLDAFKALTPAHQQLLTSNFKIGVSLGGATQMPVPYSNTFSPTNSYYYNNPVKYAQDYYNLVRGTGLENLFDLDIEGIHDKWAECATFIGEVCKELKTLNPICEISHAPQTPYFCASFGNVYDLVYKNYRQFFSFFNVQMYNNGSSNTFAEIFTQSATTNAPLTSVLELMNNHGIDPSYIVVGKTISGQSLPANGYVDLGTMATFVQQAFNTPSLSSWAKSSGSGEMLWFWNTQSITCSSNTAVNTYFSTVSKLSPPS